MKEKDRKRIYLNAPSCLECICTKCVERKDGNCFPCKVCMGSIVGCPVYPHEKLKGETIPKDESI